MNIRDVHGFDSPQALYEFVTVKHKLHAGSMDAMIQCVAELQQRALANAATKEEKEKTE